MADDDEPTALEMLDEPDHEARYAFLVDHIARGDGAVVVWWQDDLLPIRRGDAWCLDLWPTEEVARLSIADLYPGAEIKRYTAEKFLSEILPDQAECGEVIGGFPNRDRECWSWYPEAMAQDIEEAAEYFRLIRAEEAGTISEKDAAKLRRMYGPHLIADLEIRERVREKHAARKRGTGEG